MGVDQPWVNLSLKARKTSPCLIAALAQNIRQQKRRSTVLGLREYLILSHLASIDTTLASRGQAPFVCTRTSLSASAPNGRRTWILHESSCSKLRTGCLLRRRSEARIQTYSGTRFMSHECPISARCDLHSTVDAPQRHFFLALANHLNKFFLRITSPQRMPAAAAVCISALLSLAVVKSRGPLSAGGTDCSTLRSTEGRNGASFWTKRD